MHAIAFFFAVFAASFALVYFGLRVSLEMGLLSREWFYRSRPSEHIRHIILLEMERLKSEQAEQIATRQLVTRYSRGNVALQVGKLLDRDALDNLSSKRDAALANLEHRKVSNG